METQFPIPEPGWKEVVEALGKPLLYASRADFANLHRLKGVGPYIHSWLEKAGRLGPPPFSRSLLTDFAAALEGFDSLNPEARRSRIREAQALLERMKAGESPAAEVPPLSSAVDYERMRRELQTPIQFIKGVGPRLAEILKKKNIRTVEDALYFLPRAYEDRRFIKKFRSSPSAATKPSSARS